MVEGWGGGGGGVGGSGEGAITERGLCQASLAHFPKLAISLCKLNFEQAAVR